jgi:hypothetical protein
VPATTHRFVGTLTNEEGSPLPDALVVLTYVPDIGATQTTSARTGGDGRYEFQLNANQPGNVNATIRASASAEYAPNTQLVRLADVSEKNIRLRRFQTITVGQSAVIGFDADSSRCTAPRTEGICESVRVRYPSTFTSTLEVRANGDAGAVVPALVAEVPGVIPFFASSRVAGQGSITLPIGNEDWWDLYTVQTIEVVISIPDGSAPHRYEVMVH